MPLIDFFNESQYHNPMADVIRDIPVLNPENNIVKVFNIGGSDNKPYQAGDKAMAPEFETNIEREGGHYPAVQRDVEIVGAELDRQGKVGVVIVKDKDKKVGNLRMPAYQFALWQAKDVEEFCGILEGQEFGDMRIDGFEMLDNKDQKTKVPLKEWAKVVREFADKKPEERELNLFPRVLGFRKKIELLTEAKKGMQKAEQPAQIEYKVGDEAYYQVPNGQEGYPLKIQEIKADGTVVFSEVKDEKGTTLFKPEVRKEIFDKQNPPGSSALWKAKDLEEYLKALDGLPEEMQMEVGKIKRLIEGGLSKDDSRLNEIPRIGGIRTNLRRLL